MVSPRPLSKKAIVFLRLINVARYCAFLGGGLGEPLFGPQRVVPPENEYEKRTVFRMTFRRIVVYTEHGLSETGVFMRFGFPHHHGRWPPIMEADT